MLAAWRFTMSNTLNNLPLVLSDAIKNNKFDNALAAIKSLRPIDLADTLALIDPNLSWRLLELLPNRAEVFTYFAAEQQVRLARELPRATLAKLVSEMPADERTDHKGPHGGSKAKAGLPEHSLVVTRTADRREDDNRTDINRRCPNRCLTNVHAAPPCRSPA